MSIAFPKPDTAALEVEGLSVEFRAGGWFSVERPVVRAVQEVSFAVPRGCTFAIVGESGSGKTTLARAMTGLVRPSAGRIRIAGQDVTDHSPRDWRRLRAKVQMVLQDPRAAIDPRMRVHQVLREALIVHRLSQGRAADEARIATVIRQVGLGLPHLDRFANELSGGQRQRVAIARAIIVEPEILVLDEPVSALDVSIQAQIVNLLAELQASLGLTYLMISHDLALVGHVADAIGVMYLGRMVELGPTPALTRAPAHPYTESLLALVPTEDPAVERARAITLLEGQIPSPMALPAGCAFHTRCPRARALAIGGALPGACTAIRPEPVLQPAGTIASCHHPLSAAAPDP